MKGIIATGLNGFRPFKQSQSTLYRHFKCGRDPAEINIRSHHPHGTSILVGAWLKLIMEGIYTQANKDPVYQLISGI